ncbi:MAG: hypothetical protein QW227_00265 [Candidatus Aenigmatarchaeota archaeon]
MVCWVVPLMTAIICHVRRMIRHDKGARGFWLNIMLLGGALFGMIDHIWNGELFLIGTNWVMDLVLGSIITGGITVSWSIIAFKTEIMDLTRQLNCRLGFLNSKH